MAYLQRTDIDVHFGDDFIPRDDNNNINEQKITDNIEATDSIINLRLRRAGVALPVTDAGTLSELKPIALDICSYLLNNRPSEDAETFVNRKDTALKELDLIIEGLSVMNTKSEKVGINYLKIET